MSLHVALHHVTHYRFDKPISLTPHVIRLRPAPHCRTPVLSYSLKVEPSDHFINWQQDPFSNYLGRVVFPKKTTELKITVDLIADMSVYNPFDFFLEPSAEQFPFSYDDASKKELAPYLDKVELGPHFKKFIDNVDKSLQGTIDFLVSLNQQVHDRVNYLIRLEPGVQTPEQTLSLSSGSCRDSGWLLVQALRHLGLAARFVSGYLIQLTPDVKSLDGPSGTDVDFTDLHAWCEVYLPGAGWIGLDPTSGLLAGEGHIPLACSPEPSSAAPVTGGLDECQVTFSHDMHITRILESPRVTKPYTDAQWQHILALGHHVDDVLNANDVRLTMGGEPTFVSVDDRDSAEWNTEALGPTKRGLATELVKKLRKKYGEGGFLHFGQGKWYPGEQLPRWALSIYWRADGEPCWHNPELFADERQPTHYTQADALRFLENLTPRLGLSNKFIQPAYEDAWYYLWRERRLPINVDPHDSRIDDEHERARLRKIFDQGLAKVAGYILPLKRGYNPPLMQAVWQSSSWLLRDERLYVLPGDSPIGYRLPLDALPWVAKSDYPYLHEPDPFAAQAPLTASTKSSAQNPLGNLLQLPPKQTAAIVTQQECELEPRDPKPFESVYWITRTTLCVEVRNGFLYVFMPPLASINDYLELVQALEQTAQATQLKIIIEGYAPPRDHRLKVLQVTPDPGVIEVNIHPASSWDELVDHTEFLYQTTHETRLSSEKFMIDGRHTGTGGGNHFVLGGATAADSPFLRRPDVLTSLIAYWHNHPSLSYLFSGLFIGPTSQAPRFDEARNDQVYEVELALNTINQHIDAGKYTPPWLIDRALRNLLVDVTGNTHRAEFCIDKLYSPDSATGRLGLLELRAFEMPPHARMSLVQQLLLRALVARFWQTPYRATLTRWGTALHDRFMLPSFVQMDFDDVIADLKQAGFAFESEWFAPHIEFRFAPIGELAVHGMNIAIRSAMEPWHVMGEEGAGSGTVRYVDSSLERLEVKVTGLNEQRHVITVNGYALPLQPTGRVGEYVAGVRYKAWAPTSALHPQINVHAPLTFDVIDTWQQCSLGGGQYHVAHPGGRNYETFPVNAYEAESRRLARFFKIGHSAGKILVSAAQPSREFPFTLDLRRVGLN